MWAPYDDRRPFLVLLVALIAMTWLALGVWSASPYGRFLDHGVLHELEVTISGEYFTFLLIFVAGWTLMTVAMMLPTSLPLITMFRRLTSQRRDRLQLVALLIAGYLGVWVLFGAVAHFSDLLVHKASDRSAWLEHNAWVIGAGTITLAGLYQFTPLKYKCLDKCRSPLGFITEHWRGSRERSHAFRLGMHHGLFCVGCCWSLMLLMFVVGVGNLAWMLALGAIMAVEKNMPWGKKISAPLGIALVGWGLALAGSATLIAEHSH